MSYRARAICILVCLACGFSVVSFNLIQIQLVQHDKYWKLAVENHLHPETIPSSRGSVFDGDGNLLAETQTRTDLRLDGKLVEHPVDQLTKLADILQLPVDQLVGSFDPKKRDISLALNLEDSTVAKLRALKWNCLIFRPHDRRFYPNSGLASHILGFVDNQGHGAAGVEKQMDKSLSGIPGQRFVEKDGKGRVIAGYQTSETPAVDGYDVTLTVRMAIQHVVETQLDQIVDKYTPNAAYIVVMEPHTGEILAMGSRPTYDPNDSTTFKPENLRNRCITDMVEPGSVFKIITMSGALNEGLINLDTPVFCENGSFAYGGKILHDDEKAGFGWLPAREVMAQSSNIGFAKLGLQLGEQRLYKYATAFGIGQRTGLFDQQGESTGMLAPVNKWSALSVTRIPMGQEVAATPIQLAAAMSVIANGGRFVVPRLIKQVTDKDGRVVKIYQPRAVRQVISPDAARQAAKALQQVTIDGTAKSIHIQDASGWRYSFAGKTGTAQKIVNGEYSHTQHVASFVGFMPAESPAFVTLVMVDDPHTAPNQYYGAQVSAPVFANVAKEVAQILNIPPDIPPVAGTTTPAAALSANNPPSL